MFRICGCRDGDDEGWIFVDDERYGWSAPLKNFQRKIGQRGGRGQRQLTDLKLAHAAPPTRQWPTRRRSFVLGDSCRRHNIIEEVLFHFKQPGRQPSRGLMVWDST